MVGNCECNTERGFKNQLYIELGIQARYFKMNLASMCNKMKEEDLRWHSTMTPWVNRWRDVLPPVASLLHFLLTLEDLPSILPTLLVLSFYVSILFLPFHSYPSLAHRRCCCFSTGWQMFPDMPLPGSSNCATTPWLPEEVAIGDFVTPFVLE